MSRAGVIRTHDLFVPNDSRVSTRVRTSPQMSRSEGVSRPVASNAVQGRPPVLGPLLGPPPRRPIFGRGEARHRSRIAGHLESSWVGSVLTQGCRRPAHGGLRGNRRARPSYRRRACASRGRRRRELPSTSISGRNEAGRALREVGATMTTERGRNSSAWTITPYRSPCRWWPTPLGSLNR